MVTVYLKVTVENHEGKSASPKQLAEAMAGNLEELKYRGWDVFCEHDNDGATGHVTAIEWSL